MNGDFGAPDGAAGKGLDPALVEGYYAVAISMDGVIAGKFGALAGPLGEADLAYDDLAGPYFFAAKKLNTEALAAVVVDVLRGSPRFDV